MRIVPRTSEGGWHVSGACGRSAWCDIRASHPSASASGLGCSMRPIALLGVVTGALALASACSDDGGTNPTGNTAPVADFAVPPCAIGVPCNFTSTSTDDAVVTEWSWDFD